ncbi:hypothetical protein Y032_0158g3244 [Ancylostoma ceylanicum]|uniref:Uncharacterized protein n=1 Tax=Ancylostoma ceylanicum TaxID=53326 RepID=A0A016SYQ2_9BILA|nr:hypothetical protein Y032_0158g3244 [Ancylostoma ceylanicum]
MFFSEVPLPKPDFVHIDMQTAKSNMIANDNHGMLTFYALRGSFQWQQLVIARNCWLAFDDEALGPQYSAVFSALF